MTGFVELSARNPTNPSKCFLFIVGRSDLYNYSIERSLILKSKLEEIPQIL